jgi:hypothetical protein
MRPASSCCVSLPMLGQCGESAQDDIDQTGLRAATTIVQDAVAHDGYTRVAVDVVSEFDDSSSGIPRSGRAPAWWLGSRLSWCLLHVPIGPSPRFLVVLIRAAPPSDEDPTWAQPAPR